MEENDSNKIIQIIKKFQVKFRNGSDAIAFVLYLLMKEKNFRFVGCGEINNESVNQDIIPSDWNKATDSYSFRYKHSDISSTILIKIIVIEEQLLVHALEVESKKLHNLELNTNDFINNTVALDNYDNLYKNLENLITIFNMEIVDSIVTSKDKIPPRQQTNQKENVYGGHDPLRVPPRTEPRPYPNPLIDPDFEYTPYTNPFGTGHSDVFPIPGGPSGLWGPGNLIGPNHPGFNPANDPNRLRRGIPG